MLHNYLTAALRNLARNRLYSAITISGLAIGVCAALMAALVIHNQLNYDRFIPGYSRIYLAVNLGAPVDQPFRYTLETTDRLAPILKLQSKSVEAVTRLAQETVRLRRNDIEINEKIYWADPNAFEVLPLPTFAGDLRSALRRPESIVIPRGVSRKYFGRDDAIGETLLLKGNHPMTVTAVIEDLPVNGTTLDTGIFASALAPYSSLSIQDDALGNSDNSPGFSVTVRTYLRLAPNASPQALRHMVPELAKREWPMKPPFMKLSLDFIRLDEVHDFPPLNPGLHRRLIFLGVIGGLILLVACTNFINLVTARAARRAKEVGVRKVSGASRGALIVQFLGEALVYAMLAMLLGVAFAEWALPYANAFLTSGARFDYWRHPSLLGWAAFAAAALAVAVGTYPAFVLSAFRPVNVLKGLMAQSHGANRVRQALVTLQFAILIGLMIAAGVVQQQHRYAMRDALRIDTDQVLIIRSPCNTVFATQVRSLAGVRAVACSGEQLLGQDYETNFIRPDGSFQTLALVPIEASAFGLYGLKLLGGTLGDADNSGASSAGDASHYVPNRPYIINESAMREIGFTSPQAAAGHFIRTRVFGGPGVEENQIVGVIPDFSLNSVERKIGPTAYVVDPRLFTLVSVKLAGQNVPETLAAIDRLWSATAGARIERFFLDYYIQNLYLSIQREAQTFGLFSVVAVLLACLGLFGLSACVAERRTKEIGIRKAMGAGHADIARLLLWQFARPVLWANLIAWPAVGFIMNRWLHGFAYHVDLQPWLFVASSAMALVIALLTVGVHCWQAARARPVIALRYE